MLYQVNAIRNSVSENLNKRVEIQGDYKAYVTMGKNINAIIYLYVGDANEKYSFQVLKNGKFVIWNESDNSLIREL